MQTNLTLQAHSAFEQEKVLIVAAEKNMFWYD